MDSTLLITTRILGPLTEQMTPDQIDAAATEIRRRLAEYPGPAHEEKFILSAADALSTLAAGKREENG